MPGKCDCANQVTRNGDLKFPFPTVRFPTSSIRPAPTAPPPRDPEILLIRLCSTSIGYHDTSYTKCRPSPALPGLSCAQPSPSGSSCSLLSQFCPPANSCRCRTFTTMSTPVRPSLTALPIRRPTTLLPSLFTPVATTTEGAFADVVPAGAVSAHPGLAGAMQMRCGPRNTMNGHTRLVQKRRHGFLYRMRSRTGRKILQRRKLKGRKHVAW